MENLTSWTGSKLSIAFIRPIQPTWKRSSGFSPRPVKRWTTLSTSLRFPLTSSSRAVLSPCFARAKSVSFCSSVSTLSEEVFTPQISTLLYILIPSGNLLIELLPYGSKLIRLKYFLFRQKKLDFAQRRWFRIKFCWLTAQHCCHSTGVCLLSKFRCNISCRNRRDSVHSSQNNAV